MDNDNETFFEVDSKLLFELGEYLIPNRAIALAETVKNAYDADASKVTITLQSIKKPGGVIEIQDNGVGISESLFKSSWMRIASLHSERNPLSEMYLRRKAGKKGIGRFACRKIAKRLYLGLSC